MSTQAKIYYLRHIIFGQVDVEVADPGTPVEQLKGFIRRTPEITSPDDITQKLIDKLKTEADAWVKAHPEETHA